MSETPTPEVAQRLAQQAERLELRGALREARETWDTRADHASELDARLEALDRAARVTLLLGEVDEAIRRSDEVHGIAGPVPALRARALALLSVCNEALSRTETAMALALEAQAGAEAVSSPTWRRRTLLDLARLWALQGRTQAALETCAAVEAEAGPAADLPNLFEARFTAAACDLVADRPVEVIRRLQPVVRQARSHGLRRVEARALGLMGRAAVDLRDYARGRAFHEAALTLHRDHGEGAGVATSLGGLGLCKLGIGNTADAVPMLRQAIATCQALRDLHAESAWRVHLDHALVLLDRMELRAKELERWIEVATRRGDPHHAMALTHTLAEVLLGVRQFDDAAAWYRRGQALARTHEDAAAEARFAAGLARATETSNASRPT